MSGKGSSPRRWLGTAQVPQGSGHSMEPDRAEEAFGQGSRRCCDSQERCCAGPAAGLGDPCGSLQLSLFCDFQLGSNHDIASKLHRSIPSPQMPPQSDNRLRAPRGPRRRGAVRGGASGGRAGRHGGPGRGGRGGCRGAGRRRRRAEVTAGMGEQGGRAGGAVPRRAQLS